MRPKLRRFLVRLAVLPVTLAIAVAALEVLGRPLVEGLLYFMVTDVDHRPKPGSSEGINSDGIRSRIEADDIPDDAFRIVMLGDSFVQGWELEDEETIPAVLQRRLRAEAPPRPIYVLNFGWVSSSPLLAERQLHDIGAKYRPDLVVHCIDMTDFNDDLKYRRWLDRRGVYWWLNVTPVTFILVKELSARWGPLHEWLFGYPADRFFHSDRPIEESLPYMQPLRENVERLARYVREELHADYVLVIFPRSYQYSDREALHSWEADQYEPLGPHVLAPFRFFEQMADEVDFPVYSLLADFQTTDVFPTSFDTDPHWNAAGAAVAVEAIHRRLRRGGQLDAAWSEAAGRPEARARP